MGLDMGFDVGSGLRAGAVAVALLIGGAPALQAQGPVEVDLTVSDGRLVVPVAAADGTTLEFTIGTGVGQTVLSQSAAAALGEHPELMLGTIAVPTESIAIFSDDRLAADGILPATLLNQYDVLFDAPNGRMVLKPFGRSVEWEGVELSDPTRVRVYHGTVLSFEASLNGTVYPATLDLRSTGLIVNDAVQTDLGLPATGAASLGLGTTTLADRPLEVLDLDIFDRWSPNGDGFVIIGSTLATDCALSISWIHQEIRTCKR